MKGISYDGDGSPPANEEETVLCPRCGGGADVYFYECSWDAYPVERLDIQNGRVVVGELDDMDIPHYRVLEKVSPSNEELAKQISLPLTGFLFHEGCGHAWNLPEKKSIQNKWWALAHAVEECLPGFGTDRAYEFICSSYVDVETVSAQDVVLKFLGTKGQENERAAKANTIMGLLQVGPEHARQIVSYFYEKLHAPGLPEDASYIVQRYINRRE